MTEYSLHFGGMVVRATLLMGVTAVGVQMLLFLFRPHSPRIHRVAWACVLLQGLLLVQWTLEVPWYEAKIASQDPIALELPELSPVLSHGTPPAAAFPENSARIAVGSWSFAEALFVVWIAGMVALSATAIGGYLLLLYCLRSARPARHAWQQEWQQLLQRFGVQSAIPLVVHDKLGPLLCRLPRGYCVVLPEYL